MLPCSKLQAREVPPYYSSTEAHCIVFSTTPFLIMVGYNNDLTHAVLLHTVSFGQQWFDVR